MKKQKVSYEEKRQFVFNLLYAKDKGSLASLCLMLMTKKDIDQIFKDKDV